MGAVAEADIFYRGPDNTRRIVVITFCRPFSSVFDPEPGTIRLRGKGAEGATVATKISGSSQSWSFEDLDPGQTYDVEISDERFQPWRQTGVKPGTTIDAHLVGNVAVVLRVEDAETGAEIPGYRLRVRFDGASFGHDTVELRERGRKAPPEGRYSLIPFDQSLLVDADGYAPLSVAAHDLVSGETRSVTARLRRGATVAGVVERARSLEPVASATVLLEPAQPTGVSASLETRTDEAGRFRFEHVALGVHTIVARESALCGSETTRVDVASDVLELHLALPANGALSGRLLGPPGASFDGMQVRAVPTAFADTDLWEFGFEDMLPEAHVDTTGGYRIPVMPEGPATVWLVMPETSIPISFSSTTIAPGPEQELGEIAIAGETRADFDLRERFPGRLAITATLDGMPGAGLVASVARLEADGSLTGDVVGGVLDPQGELVLGPLFPGSWQLVVWPREGCWSSGSEPILVSSMELAHARIDVQLFEHALQVVERDTGMVLPYKPVQLEGGAVTPVWRYPAEVVTDVAGFLSLKLPPGDYRLSAHDGRARFSRFEWTPTGPVPETVELGPPAKRKDR